MTAKMESAVKDADTRGQSVVLEAGRLVRRIDVWLGGAWWRIGSEVAAKLERLWIYETSISYNRRDILSELGWRARPGSIDSSLRAVASTSHPGAGWQDFIGNTCTTCLLLRETREDTECQFSGV